MTNLKSRKFLLAAVIFLASFVGLLLGRLDGETFLSLCQWIAGLYIVGNVAQKGIIGNVADENPTSYFDPDAFPDYHVKPPMEDVRSDREESK